MRILLAMALCSFGTSTPNALSSTLSSNIPTFESINLTLSNANDATTKEYSLDELVIKTKNQNYIVQQEAEKVFQSRKRVRMALANLLPHIRMGSILGVAFTGPASLYSAVGDLLPFLFPSNWFRKASTQRLYEAEKMSFASLRGNEIFEVESLYDSTSRDLQLANMIDQHLLWLNQVTERFKAEEIAGTLPNGSADYFQLNALKLKEDRSNLNEILSTERQAMLFAAAIDLPSTTDATFKPVVFSPLDSLPVIKAEDYFGAAQSTSYEVKALNWMVEASYYTKRAVMFGFLDPNSDQSIGFGMAAPIQIAASQTRELQALTDSTKSLVNQKVLEAVNLYNESINRFQLASEESLSTQRAMVRLIQRHDAGDVGLDPMTFIDQLSSLQNDLLTFEVSKLSQAHRNLIAKARLNRLTLQGYYTDLDNYDPYATETDNPDGLVLELR
jgi:hypothetical protein